MAQYKFDGRYLKEGGKTIANVKGDKIRKGTSTNVIGNIKGDMIRKGSGTTPLFNLRGDNIRRGSGTTKLATMKDVDKAIDGPGKIVKAALWALCTK